MWLVASSLILQKPVHVMSLEIRNDLIEVLVNSGCSSLITADSTGTPNHLDNREIRQGMGKTHQILISFISFIS